MNRISSLDDNIVIRSHLRWAAKIPALVIGPTFVFGAIGGGIAIGLSGTISYQQIAVCVAMIAFGIFLGYHMIHTFSWVEFDGHMLRARHLYTRQMWVFPREQIAGVRAAYATAPRHAVNVIADRLLGQVRGYEIQLAGRRRGIWLAVGDSANAA